MHSLHLRILGVCIVRASGMSQRFGVRMDPGHTMPECKSQQLKRTLGLHDFVYSS
jgi:hypothetical protein